MHVLVVDDDLRTAHRFARLLEDDGYLVDVVANGGDAVERLGRNPVPDVLVTALFAPRVNGLSLMRHARSMHPLIPVVFVTDHPEMLDGIDTAGPPPVVFTKPLQYGALEALLGRIAGDARALRALQE